MHVPGIPPPCFDLKTNYLRNCFFFIKIWWGKTWDMHKRAFQALKRAFLHVPHLPPPYFDFKKKTIWKVIGFLSKYVGGRPETCINVRFRPWNARFCMSHIFPHHILIKKNNLKSNWFFIKICWGKTWYMHKRAFQALKRTFCVSQIFPQHILIKKPITLEIVFFIKLWRGRPETCNNLHFRAWNARFMHVPGIPPRSFDLKTNYLRYCFFFIKLWRGKTWDMHKRAFQALKRTFMHVSGVFHHILI